ncbi:Bug family tripartite tricarboxylate transporter substrate binding protein [Pigmentiphaga kullae]|uniref:Tripartite-type tricarboxylate transporter receptor subunit TctC n=1 Tax=Pigmentiphaga kullae TaxID=151784 RepID=A0A4V2F3G9_9BURK|nr:tripartite tricarboxylate transporter substrate binding protein [Pigmentiphaga kullae]RZS84067.1 tripartite-type tricarboxylate transporter receptor subunit TctC [Pigmentiphaga kullae]
MNQVFTAAPASSSPLRRHLLAVAGVLLLAASGAQAQTWPAQTASIVVPYTPGSAPDVLARGLAERLSGATDKTVVVENKPGANAIVGSDAVAKAAATGNTLLLVDRLTLSVNPVLYAKLPYAARDLTGVSDVASVDLAVVCRADAPFKTWSEMIDHARKHPGALMVATGGQGSVHHLSLELIERHYGVQITDVPYKGMVPAAAAVVGGGVPCVVTGPETVLEHIRSGRLRGLVVGNARRSPLMPDVPTLAEAGAPGDLLIPTHFTLFAPARTPPQVIRGINAAVARAQADPGFVSTFAARGLVIAPGTPEQVNAGVEAETARLGKLIRDANIRLE